MANKPYRTLQTQLLRSFGEKLSKYGFGEKAVGQSYVRREHYGSWICHVAFIEHESDFDITVDVAIRVDAVEDLLNADNSFISQKEKSRTATVGAELGNLKAGTQQRWSVADSTDIAHIVDSMEKEFVETGLPWLQQLSHLPKMFDVIASNEKVSWLYSPIHYHRCKTAVALASILGKQDRLPEIISSCEEFLKQVRDPGIADFHAFIRGQDEPN